MFSQQFKFSHQFEIREYFIVQEPKDKKKVRSPLIVEFGNPVDQNVHSCYNRFWPGDISRKAQETQI